MFITLRQQRNATRCRGRCWRGPLSREVERFMAKGSNGVVVSCPRRVNLFKLLGFCTQILRQLWSIEGGGGGQTPLFGVFAYGYRGCVSLCRLRSLTNG